MDDISPSTFILIFIVGFVMGLGMMGLSNDNYATRAMQCVVAQQQASSTDPIATCSKVLNIYQSHHDNDN